MNSSASAVSVIGSVILNLVKSIDGDRSREKGPAPHYGDIAIGHNALTPLRGSGGFSNLFGHFSKPSVIQGWSMLAVDAFDVDSQLYSHK